MSKKCRAYSESKLGTEPPNNRKAFYAGWDAALAQQEEGGGNLPPPLPAEPVQEPVAWLVYTEGGTSAYVTDNPNDLVGAYRALALYTAPPQRKPLAEWQINDLMSGIDPEDVCSWSFRQGVYAAEKHHGVKP